MKILQKLSWLTRKLTMEINIIKIMLSNGFEEWGVDFLNIQYGLRSYSLFKLVIRLPNGGSINRVTYELDLLFLGEWFREKYMDISESLLWNPNTVTKKEKLLHGMLKVLFEFNYR